MSSNHRMMINCAVAIMMMDVLRQRAEIENPNLVSFLKGNEPEPCQSPSNDLVNDVPAYRQRHNRHTGVAKAKRQAKKGKRK